MMTGAAPAAAAISPLDAAVTLGRQLIAAIGAFSPTSAASAVEAQLALVVEQSGVTDAAALQAVDIAEAAPGLPRNAVDALEALKRLIKSRKGRNRIGALGDGSIGMYTGSGPGYVGGSGSTDYHH